MMDSVLQGYRKFLMGQRNSLIWETSILKVIFLKQIQANVTIQTQS